MPGQFTPFRGKLEKVQEDPERQEKLNAIKADLDSKKMGEVAEEYRAYYDRKEKLKEEESEVQLQLDARIQLLVANLEAAGLEQVRTNDGGTTLFIKDDVYCSQENREVFLNWIRETNKEEMLTVHYSTMSAMAKDALQKGRPLPPGLKAYFKQTIGIRRNK